MLLISSYQPQRVLLRAAIVVALLLPCFVRAQEVEEPRRAEEGLVASPAYSPLPVHDALSQQEWKRIDRSVERGLAWLAGQQQRDGSFPTQIGGQPGVTSLATMAFLSAGYRPGVEPYGKTIDRAIDFVLSCQEPDGLLALDKHSSPGMHWNRRSHTAPYNHAISGLMLGEAYGLTDSQRGERIRVGVENALDFARKLQRRPSSFPLDAYGWRYLNRVNTPEKGEADLSVTGWFVMFYRSARNAEFDVPKQHMDEAIQFVRACWSPEKGTFYYGPYRRDRATGRGMAGAGLLCLTVSGQREEAIARQAGQWILDHPFDRYNVASGGHDRFHYGAYYCSQAMYLLGGEYWRQFYPVLADTLVSNQQEAGNWSSEKPADGVFGQQYTTAMAILSLTPPYQLLPIYQR